MCNEENVNYKILVFRLEAKSRSLRELTIYYMQIWVKVPQYWKADPEEMEFIVEQWQENIGWYSFFISKENYVLNWYYSTCSDAALRNKI